MIPVRVQPGTPVRVVAWRGLPSNHPLYGSECPACGEPLMDISSPAVGVALVYVGAGRDSGWTAGSVAVHATCVPQGSEGEREPVSTDAATPAVEEDEVDERQRYWLVWVDDTPELPEHPLTASAAARQFLVEVETNDDPTSKVELVQCTREALDWAGVEDGLGVDEVTEGE